MAWARRSALGTTRSTFFRFSCFPDTFVQSLFHIRKINVCGHSGAQAIVVSRQTNLHAEHLLDPVCDGLHVARGELGLPIYLLDHTIEIFTREGIHTDA